MARTPEKLDAESWRAQVKVVTADMLDRTSLGVAFGDIDAAYYLVHTRSVRSRTGRHVIAGRGGGLRG